MTDDKYNFYENAPSGYTPFRRICNPPAWSIRTEGRRSQFVIRKNTP